MIGFVIAAAGVVCYGGMILSIAFLLELRDDFFYRKIRRQIAACDRDLEHIRSTQEQLRLFLETRPSRSPFGR